MNENNFDNPSQVCREIMHSKKVVSICVILTTFLVVSLISIFTSSGNFLLTILKWLSSRLGDEISLDEIIDKLQSVYVGIDLIKMVPSIISCIAFWLIYGGANSNLYKKGLLIFKVWLVIVVLELGLKMLALLAVCIFLISLTKATLVIVAALLVLLIVGGSYTIIYIYYYKLNRMIYCITPTVEENRNLLYVYTFVQFVLYYKGILGIVTSLGNGFLGFVSGSLQAVVYILIACCFGYYKKTVGNADIKEALDYYNSLKIRAKSNDTNTTVTKPNNNNNNPTKEKKSYTYNKPKAGNKTAVAAQEYEPEVLKLFASDFDKLDERYSSCGKTEFSLNNDCSISLLESQIVKDSISGRTLIRIKGKNVKNIDVMKVECNIVLKDNSLNTLGVIKKVVFDCGSISVNQDCLCEFGVIIPENATNGTIQLTKITYTDGLYWTGKASEYIFYSDEKKEFDINLYKKLHL